MATTNLEDIARCDGHIYIRLIPAEGAVAPAGLEGEAGDQLFRGACESVLAMFDFTEETTLRAIVGDKSIRALRTRSGRIAMVIPTGHPQSKSVARLLRRVLRRVQAPAIASIEPSSVPRETP